MKKIINGKMYDTETAKRIGDWNNNCSTTDFNYYMERLFQKKTGEFFLYGEGNAASKYSRSCGQNEWCGSSEIIPLLFEEAREWAEKKLDADTYIGIFGEPEEDESKVILSAYVRKDMYERIKQQAAQNGKNISEQVIDMLAVAMK